MIAVFLFPFGLLALLHKDRDRITIDLDDDEHGTNLVAIGIGPLPVLRVFTAIDDLSSSAARSLIRCSR